MRLWDYGTKYWTRFGICCFCELRFFYQPGNRQNPRQICCQQHRCYQEYRCCQGYHYHPENYHVTAQLCLETRTLQDSLLFSVVMFNVRTTQSHSWADKKTDEGALSLCYGQRFLASYCKREAFSPCPQSDEGAVVTKLGQSCHKVVTKLGQ